MKQESDKNQLINFFYFYCLRKHSENTLSDLTYALCETISDFKKEFLSFFLN